jgi:hypothetical protein
MTEFLNNRNAEVQRWQDVILPARPDLTDYEQDTINRHRQNGTLSTNNLDSYFLAELPQFENNMHYMGYDWRNGHLFAGTGTLVELVAPIIEDYKHEDHERWEGIQQAALLSHELRNDAQKMASTPIEDQQAIREAAELALTNAFLDLAPRLGAQGINPLELFV